MMHRSGGARLPIVSAIAFGLLFFAFNIPCVALDSGSPHLSFVWHDSYNLAPKVYEVMKREVESIFSEIAVDVSVRRGEVGRYFRRETSYPEVNVVLHPKEPAKWGFDEDALGAAFGNYAYIFFPKVMEALSLDGGQSSDKLRALNQLGQALGRVAAHEVIHVIAPGRPHAAEGLMCGSLSRLDLVRRRRQLDGESVQAIHARLFGKEAPRSIAAPPTVAESSTTANDDQRPKFRHQ